MPEEHIVSYNGSKYECIELGSHIHAHGEEGANPQTNESFGRYRCFDCGEQVIADTLEEARKQLKNIDCSG